MADPKSFAEALENLTRAGKLISAAMDAVQEVQKARDKHGPNSDLAWGNDPQGSLIWEIVHQGGLPPIDLANNIGLERAMQKINDDRCEAGRKHTRLGILLEEVFEANAADSAEDLRAELVQVVAMALDLIVDIDAAS